MLRFENSIGQSDTSIPKKVRVRTWLDPWGRQEYLIEGKYRVSWWKNYRPTKRLSTLVVDLSRCGLKVEDTKFICEGEAIKPCNFPHM